jgi:hypothetical protein
MSRRTLLPLAAFLLGLVLTAAPALASGPGEGGRRIQLDDEPAGPYHLRVVTSPTPPKVENLYVEVRVTGADSGAIIEDAEVQVEAMAAEGESPKIRAVASHDIAPIPTEYAAHLPIPEAGIWRIHIQVTGDQGAGEVSFLQRVNSPTSLSWLVTVGVPLAGLALLAAFFLWLQRSQGRQS